MKIRHLYLLLCAIAIVLPFSRYIPFHLQYGPDAVLFVRQALASYRAWFIALDAIMAAVGVCFAFPLLLYLREVHLEKGGFRHPQ